MVNHQDFISGGYFVTRITPPPAGLKTLSERILDVTHCITTRIPSHLMYNWGDELDELLEMCIVADCQV